MSKPPPLNIVDDRDPLTRERESWPMQTAGKAPSVRVMENRIAELESQLTEAAAEIERLVIANAECGALITEQIEKLTQAATFLDRMAERLESWHPVQPSYPLIDEAAADCREMAKRLRGGT